MVNTPKPNTLQSNIDSDTLNSLLGIPAHQLAVMLPNLAKSHPSAINDLKTVVLKRFSGSQQIKLLNALDGCVIEAIAAPQWLAKGQPLTESIIDIAETIASAAPVEECPQVNKIAGDPELVRLAVGVKQSPQIRLWLVLLQIVRNTNQNRILRADLEAALPIYGITVSEGARRWLYRGHGLFWNLTEKYIYFAGYKTVAKRLVELAIQKNLPNLIGTNRPGKRSMYIDVSGSLQQFEANAYAAWLASRENPTIARFTLSALWNREPRILRKWEALAGVEVVTNEAQFHPENNGDVPEHAYMYQAAIGQGKSETRFRARMVNTYHTPNIRQHHKRGQSRHVFHAVSEYLESFQPTGNCEQGEGSNASTGGLKPTGRRYFADRTKARNSAKHTGNRQRYTALGADDHNRFVWDYTPDGIQRTALGEELPLITQKHFTPKQVYAKDVIYA